MAFEIHGPKGQVLLEDEHQALFQLGAKLGERTPNLDRLWTEFYREGQIGAHEVSALRFELERLQQAYSRVVEEQLRAEGLDRIEVRKRRNRHALIVKMRDLIAMCDEAARARTGLSFIGD